MAGLSSNSNVHVLAQWRQLFTRQSSVRSAHAYAHWRDVERLGCPDTRDRHWKYTSLDRLLAHHFVPSTTSSVSTAICNALSLTFNAYRLVFIHGFFSPTLSDRNTGFWKIKIEKGNNRLTLPDPIQSEVFLHLTESLSCETTRIYLPAGKIAQRPLYILHISQGDEDKKTLNMLHYRHHIEIESGADGQIIEHFTSVNNHGYFSGARTTMSIGDNAYLSHIKLAFENRASYHFSHNDIHMGRNVVVRSNTFIFGSELTRHHTSAKLNGESSDIAINSLLLPSNNNISDTHTYIEHNKGHCISRQLHKIIARDHGKGIFNGLIKVVKHALKTNAKMTNNNLLLDCLSEIDTTPQLEVYADDVKCSHGITLGKIDEEKIFYLRSRGITKKYAQKMIIYAFASEIIEMINHEGVRNTLLTHITDVL
ncbi:FeS cluster assembly protein SufD [Candidatus Gullanella endobia]|uniref:FeS cluster assembly protein SufD n=1 Tax=Candidatus Gullanella endobia TaxID=1070130 RepID=A0A143WQ38_9ENTR|nr:Fe-S cluster assembly protein SufD [Candidatus Gullanella endobia]CUX95906.1 FeS cluster assembly protein SufD [Candidatus Gullanella endobia]